MPFDHLRITWQTILAVCGALAVIGGAAKLIFSAFSPWRELKKDMATVKDRLDKHDQLFKQDLERFRRNEERDNLTFETLFALLEHARTNNSTGLMEETSKKVQAFLIHKK